MSTSDLARPDAPPAQVPTRWMWWGIALPVFGAWVPLVAGVKAQKRDWIAWGAVVAIVAIVACVVSEVEGEEGTVGGGLLVLAWIVHGTATVLLLNPYKRRMSVRAQYDTRTAEAQHIGEERRAVIELARRDPALALELGVGRPDLPRTRHGFVVDINNAPVGVLATLPGLTADVAQEIVRTRGEIGRFESIDEIGMMLDLDPRIVVALRPRTVAL